MKKIQTKNKTRKNKTKRGSYKNRIHKKTIRKGGMMRAFESIRSVFRSPPGAGLPPPLPSARVNLPQTGDDPANMPPVPPPIFNDQLPLDQEVGNKRKREEEEEQCWICMETFSEKNIRKYGPKIGCIGKQKTHYAHKKCVSQWCDGEIKRNDGLCRCGTCQALINLPANIINAKFILPTPPYPVRQPGDSDDGKHPPIVDDPQERVPIIFQGLEDRKNGRYSDTISEYEKAQDNIGKVFTRADLGPEDVSISIRSAIITRATSGDLYALNVLERLANKGFDMAINFFITRANAKDKYAIKVLEELAIKYTIAVEFFVEKSEAGEEYATNSLATLAIDYGVTTAIEFFKDKSNAGEAYALDILGKAASKNQQESLEFLYDKTRRLYPGEQVVDGLFILLAPPSNYPQSAISKFGIRRWPKMYYPKEEKLIEWDIKMPRSWWERLNGENLPLGWYTKKIYYEASHLLYRDKNATIPEYEIAALKKPGTILHDDDYVENGLPPPVWVLKNPSRRR
jgi:hypothetical protein